MDMILDRYEVLHKAGAGGMGVVYAAHDHDLDRKVAIKTLARELSNDPEAVRIFENEARIMARIRHQHLVSVYDVIRDEQGNTGLVMEYIDGLTLDELLRECPQGCNIDQGLDHTLELLAALAYLHDRDILHRDIKASNIMVDAHGAVRLMDFGLARSLREIIQRGTSVRGTPAYMAPEQLLGHELSFATDLYAVGVTLFELFTGELPFVGEHISFHHVYTPAPDVLSKRPELPLALAHLINACLRKNIQERPESAHSAIRDLVDGLGFEDRSWPVAIISALELRSPSSKAIHRSKSPAAFAVTHPSQPPALLQDVSAQPLSQPPSIPAPAVNICIPPSYEHTDDAAERAQDNADNPFLSQWQPNVQHSPVRHQLAAAAATMTLVMTVAAGIWFQNAHAKAQSTQPKMAIAAPAVPAPSPSPTAQPPVPNTPLSTPTETNPAQPPSEVAPVPIAAQPTAPNPAPKTTPPKTRARRAKSSAKARPQTKPVSKAPPVPTPAPEPVSTNAEPKPQALAQASSAKVVKPPVIFSVPASITAVKDDSAKQRAAQAQPQGANQSPTQPQPYGF